ncbi:hypothetical protein [Haladaptatus halobius]|uniref:hypothetical protein n=1 Tax=Haladaptatus halobius TaxID=2884875 RepID=UPI001D09FC82|nr:hypothetical protein [Haladaptatus halobius]
MTSIDDIHAGQELPELRKELTIPQLFRYSAITWNPHRIHYDAEHAHEEGHPNILVQAHLHGAAIQELLMDWLGADGKLTELSWRNVGRATPDDPLYVGGEVTTVDAETRTVVFEVWTRTEESRAAEGVAAVELFD